METRCRNRCDERFSWCDENCSSRSGVVKAVAPSSTSVYVPTTMSVKLVQQGQICFFEFAPKNMLHTVVHGDLDDRRAAGANAPAQTTTKLPSPRMMALTYVFRYSSLTPCSFSNRSARITLIGDLSINCG